jgi:hypothetical protein
MHDHNPASGGSLYQFVRETLAERGGTCSRTELLSAILADANAAQRLALSQGLSPLLQNMKHSGFIELDGQLVRRTKRKVGRRRV